LTTVYMTTLSTILKMLSRMPEAPLMYIRLREHFAEECKHSEARLTRVPQRSNARLLLNEQILSLGMLIRKFYQLSEDSWQ